MTYKSLKPALLFITAALFFASVITIGCNNEKKADEPAKEKTETPEVKPATDSSKAGMDSADTRPVKPGE